MAVFQYSALDAQGVEIKDEIEALSQKEAIAKIRNLGYFPTKVNSKGGAAKKAGAKAATTQKKRRGAGGKVKVKAITQFARQLSTLQDAGLPILRSLRILEEQQKSGTFKKVIGYVGDDIEGGSTLSEAMGRHPRAFDRLLVSMVAAGETGGVLDLILSRVADFMEKAQKLKSRVKSAMIYPLVVLTAAFFILLGLMLFVVPSFKTAIAEMTGDKELPAITNIVLGISRWIATGPIIPGKEIHMPMTGWPLGGWIILIPAPFVFASILATIRRFRQGRLMLDIVNLKLPVMGQLISKVAVTRWTRTLGTLISAGVPILDALNVTRETAGNEVYANMLGKVHNSIRQGDTFAGPLRQSKTVDLIVSNMVAVGEETGDLDKMLLKIADNYDEQVDVLVASLMSMLEPIMIVVLGAIVMTIVLAIFLPMIGIITSLSSSAS